MTDLVVDESVAETAAPAESASPAASLPRPLLLLAGAILLLLMTFVAYLPVQSNGYIWDDDDYVTQNPTLTSPDGLRTIWFRPTVLPQYYPLVHTSFWIEHQLWGFEPKGYHITNVILHGLSAVLLWLLLRRLRVPGAWLAAGIFALHPVQVESVAWVTERKNVLSGFFYFASALAYVRFALSGGEHGRRIALYGAALLLFLCALLSKTVACTLPAALLVVLWWKRGRVGLRDVLPLLPFFAAGIGLGLLTAWMEKARVGAFGKEWDFTFVERCLIAGRALWFYAGKLLLPVRLTFIYPRWTISQSMAWLYLFPAGALALMAALFALRNRIGRGPLAAVLIFAGTLFPALGFFNVFPMRYSFVADHFQYHACTALIALFAAGLALAARRLSVVPRPVFQGAAALLLVVYGTLTWNQAHAYKDYATIWENTLARNPDSTIALTSVASVRVATGKNEDAMNLYRRALKVAPEDDVANFNLGKLLLERAQMEAAGAPSAPAGQPGATGQGTLADSLHHLEASIKSSPTCSHCHYFYAVALSQAGHPEESIGHYEKALQLGPQEPYVHYNYGVTLQHLGKDVDAAEQFRKAIELQPDMGVAYYGLRDAWLNQRKADEGEKALRELVTRSPAVPEARIALGDTLMVQRKVPEGTKEFQEALRLRPGWEEAAGRLEAIRRQR